MEWLDSFNNDLISHFKTHYPQSNQLNAAMLYALESPGKRLRPRFVEEASAYIKLDPKMARLLAYSIELVHLFSLVHDDLPCLDNDDFRRGLPTVHKKFDEPTALLAGDALLSFAFETFSQIALLTDPKNFSQALRYYTRAIGSEGMIGGQTKELELSQDLDLEALLKIQDLKTGALFRASILTPFLLAGISENDSKFKDAQNYANAFGFAFQIADDLVDEKQDQANAKKNILIFMGREKAVQLATDRLMNNSISSIFSATQYLLQTLNQ